MFALKRNAVSGGLEWCVRTDDISDFYREIALSTYGDMLLDDERNNRYFDAINKAVERLRKKGHKASNN